jgi:hypothetical protein
MSIFILYHTMKKTIKLTESQLVEFVNQIITENFQQIDWRNIWFKLRRLSQSFHFPEEDGYFFTFGGLDFEISKDRDSLHLMELYRNPREWDSKFRDGEEVLENYFEKIGKFVDQFNETYDFPFELMFEMGPRFDMFFYCNFEKKEDPSMSDENPNSYNL